ncbi:MAG TPA: diguanylate cyclase [Sphaerochaeta sp.]|nr:diguanylate cyclase [Sphaerochaeta sp.]
MLYYVLGQGGKRQAQDSLFVYLLFAVLLIIALELCIDIFTGRTFVFARTILTLSALLFYLLNPLPGVFYFLYIDQLHNHWEKIPKKMGALVLIPMAINAIFVLLSLFNGMIFTIDATNTYGRGEYFFLVTICGLVYVFGSYVHMFRYRLRSKETSPQKFPFVLIFPFPVVAASILQVHFEGMEIIGVSMAITLLLIFLHIQNTHANKDYLTSLYNRSLGEQYLQYLFQHKGEGRLVGGILMDINDFKAINDTYGHDMGDKALMLFADVLRESFSRSWLICRYGGDEFLVFSEMESSKILQEAMHKFTTDLAFFNISEEFPIPLAISVGWDVVDDSSTDDWTSFLKGLDEKMYLDKEKFHMQRQDPQEGQTIS